MQLIVAVLCRGDGLFLFGQSVRPWLLLLLLHPLPLSADSNHSTKPVTCNVQAAQRGTARCNKSGGPTGGWIRSEWLSCDTSAEQSEWRENPSCSLRFALVLLHLRVECSGRRSA